MRRLHLPFRVFVGILLAIGIADAWADVASRLYERGRAEYMATRSVSNPSTKRRMLKSAVSELKKYLDRFPNGGDRPAVLFDTASALRDLALLDQDRAAATRALSFYRQLTREFPKDRLADDALMAVSEVCQEIFKDTACASEALDRIRKDYSNGDMVEKTSPAIVAPSPVPSEGSRISGVRVERTESELRIIFPVSGTPTLSSKVLGEDDVNHLPERFFVDLEKTKILRGAKNVDLFENDPVEQVRFGQTNDTARIVLDFKGVGKAERTIAENVGREIVLRIPKNDEVLVSLAPTPTTAPAPVLEEKKVVAVPMPTSTRHRIVLDAGHGGEDTGARGHKGTLEKDVCLSIVKEIEAILEPKNEYEIFLTRRDDHFIPLPDRTKYANQVDGDLFVSIHANASPKKSAEGVSTYFLDNHDDQESLRVAMRENSELAMASEVSPTSPESDSKYLEIMKASMEKNFHTVQSSEFAQKVQYSLLRELRTQFREVEDVGVRSARFYVLTGAKMPAILVETSFISNAKEEKRLKDAKYQKTIARAVVKGIEQFFRSAVGRGDHAALYSQ